MGEEVFYQGKGAFAKTEDERKAESRQFGRNERAECIGFQMWCRWQESMQARDVCLM